MKIIKHIRSIFHSFLNHRQKFQAQIFLYPDSQSSSLMYTERVQELFRNEPSLIFQERTFTSFSSISFALPPRGFLVKTEKYLHRLKVLPQAYAYIPLMHFK